jgi:hypothetical protein
MHVFFLVPTLGIFTKLDELMSDSSITSKSPSMAEELVVGSLKGRLESLPCSPAAFIQLRSEYILSECQFCNSSLWIQDMHHDSEESRALCDQLLQKTKALSQLSREGPALISE